VSAPAVLLVLALAAAFGSADAQAQRPRATGAPAGAPRAATQPARSARAQAPYDLTGYWVSLVTQNWRYRMVVPMRGDYAGIPVDPRAKRFADAWHPAADIAAGKQCEAYGAPSLMQVPERLHIGWQDEQTLRVETDAGMQTRLLHFGPAPSGAASLAPSLQGYSSAHWQLFALTNTFGAPEPMAHAPRYGSLVVVTDHLLPGLLRKNGVPYGADTRMTEYWQVQTLAPDQWLMISTEVDDPEYLTDPYVYDSIFQKEADGAQWHPGACSLSS